MSTKIQFCKVAKFRGQLGGHDSWEVIVMAELEVRDATNRTTGRNVLMFKKDLGTDPRILTSRQNRDLVNAAKKPVHPEEEEWKLDMLSEMLEERKQLKAEGKKEELELIQFYCDTL